MMRRCVYTGLFFTSMMLLAACTDAGNGANQADKPSPLSEVQHEETQQAIGHEADDGQTAVDEESAELIIVDDYDITLSVTGPSLKEVYEEYFKFGTGLNGYSVATDTTNSAAMREIIKHHFNSVTYSNLMKPSYLLDQEKSKMNLSQGVDEPGVTFDSVLRGMEFARDHGIQMRGHTLIWHTQTPDWFFKEGYESNGELVDRETMLARMESYIRQVLDYFQTEYPGVIYCWDVVNEAVEIVPGHHETETGYSIRTKYGDDLDNLWYKTIGPDYVMYAFEYARKYAAPEVKLFYNDYNTFQTQKTNAIYALASKLREHGWIDGIGMQGYMSLNYPNLVSGQDNVMKAITKFSELELEIHLTELTIRSDSNDEASMLRQAERYHDLFRLLISLDTANGGPANITSVTVFGLMDHYMFYDNDQTNSRLFDGNLKPKPAFYRIMEAAGQEVDNDING